jgi:tRNA-specific 2-thiouridylase
VSLRDFLERYLPERGGAVVTTGGEVIGEHRGAHFYTIGQRHGLDLKEKNSALRVRGKHATKPHYVAAKDVRKNILVVAEGKDHPALYVKEIPLTDLRLGKRLRAEFLKNAKGEHRGIPVFARVRYRQPLHRAWLLRSYSRGLENKDKRKTGFLARVEAKLVFERPQKFVAPGQSAVFYGRSQELLGGGVIA